MPRRRQHQHLGVGAHTYDHSQAPLVAAPSAITRRALEGIGPGTLYTLLHLETLAADDLAAQRQAEAEARRDQLQLEYSAWCDVERHMQSAIAAAQRIPRVDEHGLRITQPDRGPIEIKMLDVFEIFANAAKYTAGRYVEVILPNSRDLGPFPGKLVTARSMAEAPRSQRKEITNKSVRLRLISLLALLPDWSPGDIAALIVASQSDWNPAPVKLAPQYLFSPSDIDSRDRVAAGRARRQRDALLQWIRDQRKAMERGSPRGGTNTKRRRKREN